MLKDPGIPLIPKCWPSALSVALLLALAIPALAASSGPLGLHPR